MKKIFMILVVLVCVSCENKMKNNLSWEVFPDSQSQVIEKEIDDIAFKFCLLNEQGQPATVFKEGENFSFYFSVTNKTNEKLYFFPDFAYPVENGFCEVFTSDNKRVGKPFIFRGYNKIGIGAYPFNPEDNYFFEQPWIDSRDSVWRWKYGFYESSHQTPLSVGNYYTEFQSRFQFYDNYLDTTLAFKIKFKIQ